MIRSIAALMVLQLLAPMAASAGGGPKLPRVSVSAQGERRPAGLISYNENEPTPEGGCSSAIADGFGVVREPVPVSAGRVRARLLVGKPERPDLVRVRIWRHVDEDGYPIGEGHVIHHRLQPRRRSGRAIAWVALIRPFVSDTVYGELSVTWRDHDSCGPDEGSWLFLLQA